MAEFDAAAVAQNAIGLFIEAFERMGGTLSHPGGLAGSPVEMASGSAVAEVVQGIEADIPEREPFATIERALRFKPHWQGQEEAQKAALAALDELRNDEVARG